MNYKNKKDARIAIAKDVIQQIHSSKINVRHNTGYVKETDFCTNKLVNFKSQGSIILKNEIDKIFNSCNVCALGSLFLSRIKLYNGVKWNELKIHLGAGLYSDINYESIYSTLEHYFSKEQLMLIEKSFELYDTKPHWHKISDHEERLLAIMQNIVDHDGKFKPNVEYEII